MSTTGNGSDSPHKRFPDPTRSESSKEDEEERDPYELRIERSGCAAYHYQLQECYFEHNNDWRQCQQQMKAFRDCMMSKQTDTK